MTSNANVRDEYHNNNDPSKILRGSPTKTSSLRSNAAVVNTRVDDDIRNPQPNETAPDPATSPDWNALRNGFNEIFSGFAEFRDRYGPSTDIRATDASYVRTCGADVDDNHNRAATAGDPEFLRVIAKCDRFNEKFSQLLDRLENERRLQSLSKVTSNPQPTVHPQSTQIPCVLGKVPPAPTPDPLTVALGASPWEPHSTLTIHNVTMMVENDRTFAPLPPPAPDPDEMESTGVLWPQPRPVWKTIPFKKKLTTKPKIVRRRDQDLRPP